MARARDAFTLMEVLVVIAIAAVLIALLVPAVQQVRAASLRTECGNNLRQLGLAAHHYHNARRAFPPGMRYNLGKDPMLMSSWHTQLLPYIEQQALWKAAQDAYAIAPSPFKNPPHIGLATVVRTFACPADGRALEVQIAKVENISVALTTYLGVAGKDLYSRDGILFRDSVIRTGDVTDGTSQTLLAGERPPSADFQFGWWYAGAGQKFTGSGDMVLGVNEQNALVITASSCGPGTYSYAPGNVNNQCDMFHFWSLHSGGAHFLFADGSVHFLSYGVAPVLPALASRNQGEPVSYWH